MPKDKDEKGNYEKDGYSKRRERRRKRRATFRRERSSGHVGRKGELDKDREEKPKIARSEDTDPDPGESHQFLTDRSFVFRFSRREGRKKRALMR